MCISHVMIIKDFDYNVNADDVEYEAEVLKNTFESVFNW
jgi:hypothetical protein